MPNLRKIRRLGQKNRTEMTANRMIILNPASALFEQTTVTGSPGHGQPARENFYTKNARRGGL